MPTHRVVILGGGFMGEVHYRAWKCLEGRGVEVAAVAECEAASRGWLQREGGLRVVGDFRQAIGMPGVDIVDVCLPTPLHVEAIEAAAAAGRAVVCEKPLARTASEAEAAVEAAARRGVPFMVAHVVRFFPDYRKARDAVVRGELGLARSARCFRGGAAPAWNSWMRDESQSGGVMLDLLIHDFDYLRWVFGPVARVSAVKAAVGSSGEAHAAALLRFESGAIAMAEGAWSFPPGAPFTTEAEIAGTRGLLQWSSREARSVRLWRRPPSEPAGHAATDEGETRLPESPLEPDPYALELEHFLDHVARGRPLDITPEEALAAVRVAEAAERAAREGRPVEVHA